MTTPINENSPKEPEIIVIPDECGDTLWDEVLAQHPDLTTLISKPTDIPSDQPLSNSGEEPTKP